MLTMRGNHAQLDIRLPYFSMCNIEIWEEPGDEAEVALTFYISVLTKSKYSVSRPIEYCNVQVCMRGVADFDI